MQGGTTLLQPIDQQETSLLCWFVAAAGLGTKDTVKYISYILILVIKAKQNIERELSPALSALIVIVIGQHKKQERDVQHFLQMMMGGA